MNNWLNIIQQYLLPPSCILCGQAGWHDLDLCYGCYQQLPRNTECCLQCAKPLLYTNNLCGNCLAHPPDFTKLYAPYLYQTELRYLILGLKSNAQYQHARLLALLLSEHIKQQATLPDCLIPVPLHKSRYQARGFNQVVEITKILSKQLQVPINLNGCIRQRDTPRQTYLTAKQRRHNIKGAFKVVQSVQDQYVVIIDDVVTTGSTVRELATMLKKAGAKQIDVWACARA